MENKPLLSIYIPTYNRAKYVKRLIDSIIQQDWFNENNIEVVVSDNLSNDNTKEIVNAYKFKNIIYHRNKENIWADPNILQWAELCRWEYVRVIWSDDFLLKWWISEIITTISDSNPELVIANYEEFFEQIFDLEKANSLIKRERNNKTYRTFQFRYMKQFLDFLKSRRQISEVISCFSFISILCFNRDFFLNNKEKIKKEKKRNFDKYMRKHYFGIPITIYSWLSKNIDIRFIDKNIIGAQRNNNENIWSMNTGIIKCYLDVLYTIFKKNNYNISFIPLFVKLISRRCIFFIWNKAKKTLIKLWIYEKIMKIWLKNSKIIIYGFILGLIIFIIIVWFIIDAIL